jgi:hypothetical protein
METEILIALIGRMVDERLVNLPSNSVHRGSRGFPGRDGRDGKDFSFAEHEGIIREWAKEFALKFEDLSDEQISKLRGERGQDGRPGKDFNFKEHEAVIRQWAKDSALTFKDLSDEEIEALRGPRGRDGRNGISGRSFVFEENRDAIESIIRSTVDGLKSDLKLRFSDLNDSDREQIRGPRGRDGRDGRNFVFDEHREFFESLKPKFSDLTDEEKDSLKLHFSQLTEEEKGALKLRFEDLTDDDKLLLRGPRGLRGQRGSHGRDGENGKQGARGLPGPHGIRGLPGERGADGEDGLDGADAPYVTDIELDEYGDEIYFIFYFSDGTEITTDRVKLPTRTVYGGGGAPGPTGARGPTGDPGPSGTIGPQGPPGADGADGVSSITTTFTFTDGQAATALTGEIFDHNSINEVDYIARIVRGTTVFARMEFSLFYRNGAWETVISGLRYSGVDPGVTPTSDPTTGQVYLAADTGAGDGRVELEKTTHNI